MKVVIQKEGVVRVIAKKLLSLLDVLRYINEIALKARGKPPMPSAIIIEKKNSNWMSFGISYLETQLQQQ
jgi:hypothetical protein